MEIFLMYLDIYLLFRKGSVLVFLFNYDWIINIVYLTSLSLQVAETAVQLFISNDKPNIAGLVLAGSADFKTELSQSDMFDPVS